MNNLKTSSPKDAFGQSLVEIDPMVSALGKGQAPLCQVWLKLAPLLWRRERKVKNLQSRQPRQKNCDQKSSFEPLAQVS